MWVCWNWYAQATWVPTSRTTPSAFFLRSNLINRRSNYTRINYYLQFIIYVNVRPHPVILRLFVLLARSRTCYTSVHASINGLVLSLAELHKFRINHRFRVCDSVALWCGHCIYSKISQWEVIYISWMHIGARLSRRQIIAVIAYFSVYPRSVHWARQRCVHPR